MTALTLYSYDLKAGDDWYVTFILGNADTYNFEEYKFKIDGVVYTEPCQQMQEQLEKMMVWEELQGF